MTSDKIESALEQVALNWPGSSVATAVIRAAELETSLETNTSPVTRRMLAVSSLVGTLATAAAVIGVAFWLIVPESLNAILQQSLKRSGSWHVLSESLDETEQPDGEIWFHRDYGYRMESGDQVIVDNGKFNYIWSPAVPETPVLMRPSMDGVAMVARMFDMSEIPKDWLNLRSPENDQPVAGRMCEAYLVSNKNTPLERILVLLDNLERPRRLLQQKFVDGLWQDYSRATIDYDRPLEATLFQADYPADATVVDVQVALEDRFPLDEALAFKEKDGLIFAVHDVTPIDDGSFYVVSSVRGSPEYLKKYPPTKRRLNMNYTALDVASQTRSHSNGGTATHIFMYGMEWQGADYQWQVIAPRQTSTLKQIQDSGIFQVPLFAVHVSENRRDERGVQLATRVDLAVLIKDLTPVKLSQAIAKARSDMHLVSSVIGERKSLPIAMSIKESVQFTTFDEITDKAYATELTKARWQMENGDLTGADPPANWDPRVALVDDLAVEAEARARFENLSADPVALPTRLAGRVVDANNLPIANAQVTMLIRRFNTHPDETKSDAHELDGPGPWTATTDEAGEYSMSPAGTIRPRFDEVRIKVTADNFIDLSTVGDNKLVLQGRLPEVKLLNGRRIHARLVDLQGQPVSTAVVRLASNNASLEGMWDSGPFPVDAQGEFVISIPSDGKAFGVIYPQDFAPRFIEIVDESDQGDIRLEPGVAIRGRVLDAQGNGVAGTVVGIRSQEYREMFAFMTFIGIAMKTDAAGYFQLPQLRGTFELSVGNSKPDFSKQMMINGEASPSIETQTVSVDEFDPSSLIILRE